MDEIVDHVFLTRFNVPSAGYESLIRATDGWLEMRLALFEKFCLPSVRNQHDRRFMWIIYFDPESPGWLMDRIGSANFDGIFAVRFRAEISRQDLIDDIRGVVQHPGTHLLTTNLDNDDGLAADFTERLRGVGPTRTSTAVYLANGLIRSGAALFSYRDPHNAFCSVLSPWEVPETCWADWHNRLAESMPVVKLAGSPAWLQVVHGSNVSNRVHGRQIPPGAFRRTFPALLDDLPEPSTSYLVGDALVRAPGRMVREVARSAAKRLINSVSGQDGTDDFKAWALRHRLRGAKLRKGRGVRNGFL
ncbi:glycosyltransferase [Arthrobacter sp. HS15c]|uniref:glycosyltransferase n=1 Tax=Arthrobacter sp. HS15c TaxID=3230279 RepID=UPI0034672F61